MNSGVVRSRPLTVTSLVASFLLITPGISIAGDAAAPKPAEAAPAAPAEAAPAAPATTAPSAESTKPALSFVITYLKQIRHDNPPLSLLDIPPADNGVAGARLGIADNNTTGRFLNQKFDLDVVESDNVDDLIKAAVERVTAGNGFVIADMTPDALLKLADALKDKPATILNAGNDDDSVREENCRANVMHVAPTRSMLTDALAQYFAWKQWRNWLLVSGPRPEDKLLADSFRRSAKRFGGKIVQDLEFKYESGSRRADGGFEQVQQQIPQFLQKAPDHDVLIVADEGKLFADYVPYRTWIPRPVAGSAGLMAASWHPALELWGGTQFQNRFKRLADRNMRPRDYDAWVAVRAVGEAATRKQTGDYKVLSDFMHSPEFEVAAFKGVKTTFRNWNGQLRQPIILTTPKLLVSVSPQPGFLHQVSELDTLGYDKPETKCKAYIQAK